MNLSNNQLKKYLGTGKKAEYSENELQVTIQKAKMAFVDNESNERISHAEFLFQQSKYIQKRYWIMQGILLFILWFILHITESSFFTQRCLGIGASLFAVLLLPELWKSKNANALEIESVSYFSLRQIFSARIFFLALLDFIFLCAFTLPITLTGKLHIEEIMIQFFIPYIVTCCICFQTLCSKRFGTEILSFFLCTIWCAVWTQIILNEKVYQAISLPAWIVVEIAAVFYLSYCIYKVQNNCPKMWEVHTLWN